jgi:hypothetical protein
MIDGAIIRPGRFDQHVYIPPPDCNARIAILQRLTHAMPICVLPTHESLSGYTIPSLSTPTSATTRATEASVILPFLCHIARLTWGWSPAELGALCRESAMLALRRTMLSSSSSSSTAADASYVTTNDFINVLLAASGNGGIAGGSLRSCRVYHPTIAMAASISTLSTSARAQSSAAVSHRKKNDHLYDDYSTIVCAQQHD